MERESAPRTAGSRPYLKRGAGWEARVQAAREGRRYRPKDGLVLNYTEVAAPPARRSPSKVPGPGSKPRGKSPFKAPLATVPTQAAGRQRQTAVLSRAPKPSGAQPQRGSGQAALPPLLAEASLAGTAPPLGATVLPAWGSQEADEDLELKEFCALESEVLREVSNTAQRSFGGSAQRGAQPRTMGGRNGAPDVDDCKAACIWPGPQLQVDVEGEEEEEEDVFQSDGEGGTRCAYQQAAVETKMRGKTVSFAEPSAQGPAASGGDVDEEEAELVTESELLEEVPLKPTSGLVQKFFYSQKPERMPPPPEEKAPKALLQKQVEEIEQQVKKLNEERTKLAQQRRQVEEAKSKLEQDKAAFEKRKAEGLAQVEAMKAEELRKLQRDRRVLEQQSRALLKLPTKREKEEIQALEAVLEKERQNAKGKDARHKLTVDRLRRQILELQDKNNELREQVQHLEAQRLQHWGGSEQGVSSPVKRSSIPFQPSSTPSSALHSQGGRQPVPCKDSSTAVAASPFRDTVHRAADNEAAFHGDGHTWASSAAHQEDGSLGGYNSEFEDGGQVLTEELDEDGALESNLPTVRVSVHKAQSSMRQAAVQPALQYAQQQQQQQQQCPQFGAPQIRAATASQRLSLEEGVQPAGGEPAVVAPAGSVAGAQVWPAGAEGAAAQEVVADVMSKASTALHRFNQLKESLIQHSSLQQKLSSRLSSLQATPAATPALAPAMAPAPEVPDSEGRAGDAGVGATTQDALRQLGRMLTSGSSGPAAGFHTASASFAMQSHRAPAAPGPVAAGPSISNPPHRGAPTGSTAGAAGGPAALEEDCVVSERQYSDGHVERVHASGLRLQQFPNGSAKRHWPDGRTATCFANGDVKNTWPDGRVEYYYDAVGCWHVTHPSNCEVFYFPSGQIEAHHPGQIKEILFPDGTVKKILPDGRELAITAMHLSWEIQQPQPRSPFGP